MQKETIHISGMHCASCATNIQRKLTKLSGVTSASVSYANEQATIEFDEKKGSMHAVNKTITSLGYTPHDSQHMMEMNMHHEHEIKDMGRKLTVSTVLTVLLLFGAMFPFSWNFIKNPWIMLLLATPVQFWVGYQYYKSAIQAIRHGLVNMDTLIALGTTVAYGYSCIVLLFGDILMSYGVPAHFYFETSATIITLILMGKFLEVRAKGKTSQAIQKLIGLQAKTARVLKGKTFIDVPIEDIVVGDRILIRPGEKIPLDGEVVKGETLVNESMVTGESMPSPKKAGSKVIGATVNGSGSIEIVAKKVGNETFLAQMIALVQAAQSSKANIQKLVDVISSYFVPAVIVLSILAFGLWMVFGPDPKLLYAVTALISVLIIACPCALGLATPTSIVVGVGKGAQEGILIRDAQVLESSYDIDTVVFDKTGTLTLGKPTVQNVFYTKSLSSNEQKQMLSFLSLLESKSHHPLAQAIVQFLDSKGIGSYKGDVKKFEDHPGYGITAEINKKLMVVGTETFMSKSKIVLSPELVEAARSFSKKAYTLVFIAYANRGIGVIGIADAINEKAKETITKLKKMNINVVLLTGDNREVAQAVAGVLGIETVYAHVLPQEKERVIQSLKEQGKKVCMVGDGINDAPSLASADVGIAMGNGTDIAIEAAGVALLRGDISLVPKVFALSKSTIRNIKQNLLWAFGYNVILIPVAMGILYPMFKIQLNPMLASAAMALSSVSVVTNALRLKRVTL